MTPTDGLLQCSFCGKSQRQVRKLVAGPGVYICDECVGLCCAIMEEQGACTHRGSSPHDRPEEFLRE